MGDGDGSSDKKSVSGLFNLDGYRIIRWIFLLAFLNGCGGGFIESLAANAIGGMIGTIAADTIKENEWLDLDQKNAERSDADGRGVNECPRLGRN